VIKHKERVLSVEGGRQSEPLGPQYLGRGVVTPKGQQLHTVGQVLQAVGDEVVEGIELHVKG
jgi:hypothetical protein